MELPKRLIPELAFLSASFSFPLFPNLEVKWTFNDVGRLVDVTVRPSFK